MPNPSHPAELLVHQYMSDAVNGKTTMPDEVIEQVGKDVMDAPFSYKQLTLHKNRDV